VLWHHAYASVPFAMSAPDGSVDVSLAEDLANLDDKPSNACWAGLFINGLPDAERAALHAALIGTAATTKIWATLTRHGHDVSFKSLLRHRKTVRGQPGGCNCTVTP
jgi:hypothetical protein